jgi:hypothetical protein
MDPRDLVGLREPHLVDVAGGVYEVGVHPLRVWMGALLEPLPLLAVLPLAEARVLNSRSYDKYDDIDTPDFAEGWHQALAAATGLDWFVAERLMLALMGDWPELAGRMLLKGIDPLVSPPDLVLHALLAMALEGQDESGRRKFLADLYKAPPGAPRGERPGFSPEEQAAAFESAVRANTPGVRA